MSGPIWANKLHNDRLLWPVYSRGEWTHCLARGGQVSYNQDGEAAIWISRGVFGSLSLKMESVSFQ